MLLLVKSLLYSLEQILIIHKIIDEKINWSSMKVCGAVLLGMCVSYLCSFSFFSYLRSLFFIFFLIFVVVYLFCVPISKTLGIVFLDFFSNMLVEMTVAVIVLPFIGVDGLTNDVISIILQFLIFLGTYFVWNFSLLKRVRENLITSPPTTSLFFSLFALSGYSIFVICSLFGKLSFFGGVIFSLMILLFLGLSFYGFFLERSEYVDVLKKYELLLETVEDYEKLLEEERMIRHEHKNQWMILRSLVKEKEATSYIDTILKEEIERIDGDYANNLSLLPFQGMSGLFYYKYFAAEKLGICLKLEVGKNVQVLKGGKYPVKNISALLKVVGVFLDNALEGAGESALKEVDVTVYKNKEEVFITIANSFSSKVDLSQGFIGTTTKGKNHGYGLLLVQKLLKEYKFMNNKTEIISNVFVQTIEVDLKKMKND